MIPVLNSWLLLLCQNDNSSDTTFACQDVRYKDKVIPEGHLGGANIGDDSTEVPDGDVTVTKAISRPGFDNPAASSRKKRGPPPKVIPLSPGEQDSGLGISAA